ncbi:MAG: tetratricopeptide repeat protein [Verrucomicrobiota bacterium]
MLGSSFFSNCSEKFGVRLILAALIVSVFLLYSPVWYFDFVNYDDPDYVTQNPWVQAGLTVRSIAWAFGSLHGEQTYWHPLTWLSHMLDCQLFGLNAGAHHLVNVLFHALNVGLLFLVLKRLTGAVWRSAIVAALFALHPLQVDTVAWITERKNLLTTLFGLLTLWAYASYVEKPSLKRYLPLLLWFALCLMCKPALAPLPCALLLLDYWPLGRWGGNSAIRNPQSAFDGSAFSGCLARLILEKVPLLALSVGISVMTMLAHETVCRPNAEMALTPLLRAENAFVSYAAYVRKLCWPFDLAAFYPHPGAWPMSLVLGSSIFLLVLTGLALWLHKQLPSLAVGWFWFLGLLVPAIGLIQVGAQAMADRFVYLPLVGLFIALTWLIADLLAKVRCPIWARALPAVLACLAFGFTSARQLHHWQNSITLWERVMATIKNNGHRHSDWIAYSGYGCALMANGQFEAAKRQLQIALDISPESFSVLYNMGCVLESQGDLSGAAEYYKKAVAQRSGISKMHKSLVNLYMRTGRLDAAIAANLQAIKSLPPDDLLHLFHAQLLMATRDYSGAISHYQEALKLNPDSTPAQNDLAWLLATAPQPNLRNGAEAVRLAEAAAQATGYRQILIVGTLAAAYAEAGQFPKAVATAEKAIAMAQAQGQTALVETNRRLLQEYRQNRPHRQSPE